ncbi:MAG: hypothetical protein P8Y80_15855 [Acidobacteriota bacterium]
MSDQPRKKRSARPRKRGKREQPVRKRKVSAHVLKQISAHLPDELQAFVQELFQNQAELEKRLDSALSDGRNPGSAHLAASSVAGEHGEAEVKQDLAADVLRVLNRGSGDVTQLIREVLRLINERIGFDAVGLRLHQGEDYPYYEHRGFTKEFLFKENFLCSRSRNGNMVMDSNGKPVLECT